MPYRKIFLVALVNCFSISLLAAGTVTTTYADQSKTEEMQRTTPGKIHGKVTDILNASGYTYAEVDTGKEKVWAAATTTPLKIGDMVSFTTEMPMHNFHSNSMKRDFSVIYFISSFNSDNKNHTVDTTTNYSPHSQIRQIEAAKEITGINKVEGGNTIAEIYDNKHDLNGKVIRLRGQVTKVTANIMGRNWLHIRDSSSLEDLTVTTENNAANNDIVVIEGKLALDKDFGYGYVYPVIVENARITKE
jgi:hypothetical protein